MTSFKKPLLLLTAAVYGLFGPVGAIGKIVCIESDGKIRIEESSLPGACCASLLQDGVENSGSGFLSAASSYESECGECLDILLVQESQHYKINTRNSRPTYVALLIPLWNAAGRAGIKSATGAWLQTNNFNFAPQNLSFIRTTRLLI